MAIHTMENVYTLEYLEYPELRGNDRDRVHALKLSEEEMGYYLYYTVVSQYVISAQTPRDTSRPANIESYVKSHGLQMLLQLHEGHVDLDVKAFNQQRKDKSTTLRL